MAIVDFKTNKALTSREIKKRVMQATGWTSEQYQKQYDILRNKTRNYETITGSSTKIKVNELLYKKTLAERRYGTQYKASRLVRAIEATPSASTGTVKRQGVSSRVSTRLEREILGEFRGLITKSTDAGKIAELYKKYKGVDVWERAQGLEEREKAIKREIKRLNSFEKDEGGAPVFAEEIERLKKELGGIEAGIEELKTAPTTIAELKQQLTSTAKSLKAYKKTKQGEWKRMNPDAPAGYIVGTP